MFSWSICIFTLNITTVFSFAHGIWLTHKFRSFMILVRIGRGRGLPLAPPLLCKCLHATASMFMFRTFMYFFSVYMLTFICQLGHSTSDQHRKETYPTWPPHNWMIFCEITVPNEISIPAKFYCFMATRFWTADIKFVKKHVFFGTGCLREIGVSSVWIEIHSSFYAHFKANEMPFPMTYYTNVFSTLMYPRSSYFTFDLYFSECSILIFLKKNAVCM
jgi:hypothetical protein